MATLRARSSFLALLLTACGASESAAPPTREAEPTPATEVVTVPEPALAAPTTGDERCEGLVGGCGGWTGCVLVRPDPTTPGRLVGIGESAGHFYVENHACHAGVCDEVCGGGSESVCRPGLAQADDSVACSEAFPPSRAPFTCTLVDGACVQGPDPRLMPAS